MNVLVINCGSSSLKYQLINSDTEAVLAKGLCERIGIDGRLVYQKAGLDKEITEAAMPTHKQAIQMVLDALVNDKTGAIADLSEIDAVGHRVVHGGEKFSGSVLITEKKRGVQRIITLSPELRREFKQRGCANLWLFPGRFTGHRHRSTVFKAMKKYSKILVCMLPLGFIISPTQRYLWSFITKFVMDIVTTGKGIKELLFIVAVFSVGASKFRVTFSTMSSILFFLVCRLFTITKFLFSALL